MSFEKTEGLTIGDRLNYPYILSKAILYFLDAIVKSEGEYSQQEAEESAKAIRCLMLKSWTKGDKDFEKDIEKATIVEKVDLRPKWCGIPVGDPVFKEVTKYEPYLTAEAGINLLDRRGLLSKKVFTEKRLVIREQDTDT